MRAAYTPGGYPAWIADGGVVVVEPGRHELLAELYGEPLSVGGVVDALLSDGWASIPQFACVVVDAGVAKVLVRGGFAVGIAGETISGEGVATWTERQFAAREASAFTITTGESAGGGEDLPLDLGVVLAQSVRVGSPVPEVMDEGAAPAPVPEVRRGTRSLEGTDTPETEEAPAAPKHAAELEEVLLPETSPPEEAPVPEVRRGTSLEGTDPEEAPDPAATIAEPDDLEFDAMFGATVPGRRPEDAAVRDLSEPEPEPSAEPQAAESAPRIGDHDGHTIARADLRRLREQRASSRAAEPVRATVELALSTGETHTISGAAVVGRSPRTSQAAGAELPTLVIVDDPYVSGTHLSVAVEDGSRVTVTDVSTNGTLLSRAGGAAERLPGHVPTSVADGDVLTLSDDLKITVRVRGGA
ncbi:MAG: FHA domain-containing protein [Aeromicrobium sp.]|uniref:FHA domain-containing protein n=1 Tax=Aeromicrobium sp. TaxID=1871063 RepID=UPI0039E2E4A7